MRCFLLPFALGLFGATPALAADYHVATGGDDGATGLSGHPWATIGHAAAKVAPGDVVHVAGGVYHEAVASDASGTAASRIRFVSDSRFGAHLDAAGHYTAWQNTGDYVDIEGFEVTGADYLGILNLGSYTRIASNHVHHLATPTCNNGNGGAGIDDGNYSAHDCDIVGNIVHDILPPQPCNQVHGIYHSNLRGHVWNNLVYQIGGYGIHIWHAGNAGVIANNLVFRAVQGGMIVGAGDSPGGVIADNFFVANNVVIDNPGFGIREYGATGAGNQYVDNLVWSNGTDWSLLTGTKTGSLSQDPLLVNYQSGGSGDYHLTAQSPCVDRGTSTNAPADDLDGVPRPSGTAVDLGPYEFVEADAGTDASQPADATPGADASAATADAAAPLPQDAGALPPADASAMPTDASAMLADASTALADAAAGLDSGTAAQVSSGCGCLAGGGGSGLLAMALLLPAWRLRRSRT